MMPVLFSFLVMLMGRYFRMGPYIYMGCYNREQNTA